jgi:2-isopropylmalate synthase
MDPHSVGVPDSRLVLGKHSGRHALAERCTDLGYELTRDELDRVYVRFTALADHQKGVRNDEIVAMIVEETGKRAQAALAN